MGFQKIHESDMILFPDPTTAFVDPFMREKTLVMNCFIGDPVTGESYSRDPRYVAKKAEDYLTASGAGGPVLLGPGGGVLHLRRRPLRPDPELRLLLPGLRSRASGTREPSPKGGNKGYKPRYKEGYFPVPPMDQYQDLRSDMVLNLRKVGLDIEVHHHEVGTAGQAEIDLGFGPLLKMADALMLYKYIVKGTGMQAGKTITFMPKPIFQDNGSGMHVHQSLWKDGEPLFYGDGYANLSRDGHPLHRRHPAARPGSAGPVRPHHQLLQAAGPGLRGAGEPGVLAAQPVGGGPDPAVLEEPQEQANRVPLPGPVVQPVLRLLGDVDGGPRRHEESMMPPEPVNRDMFEHDGDAGPVPTVPGPWSRRSTPWRRTTSSCSRAACSPRT